MADQLVAATIGVLLEKAISAAADRIGLALGVGFHKDLEAMQEHAKDIQAVLADAEKKQSQSLFVLRWLRKVEAAATEAEYVLDELLYETLRRKVESMNKRAAKVCLFFSLSKHDLSFRWRMGSKVREINAKFEKFILEIPGTGLTKMEVLPTADVVADRQTNSLPLPFVAGRDKEVSKIVDTVLSNTSASVSALSIVGMGGLGKTTLAKAVYNNPGIESHFGKQIWVCVSDKFVVTELFRLMLESLVGGKVEKSSQDGIVRKIREELGGKRFLLVLDDVWNEDQKLWDAFFTSLVGLNSASGSCCLVTTRLHKTAKLVSTFDPFILEKLPHDECWYILCKRATRDGEMPQQLNAHKDQILKRCQGLPLAANVVGGLLSLQNREEWLSIVEDKILKEGEYVEGEITPILRLSFDYLPSLSIKKCFAYCSIFCKDAKMCGDDLVELWMAEGFLQEDAERRTMEEVGHDHLTILLQSSMLEKVYDESDIYQMHDLVHDLAESVSKGEQIDGEVRHIALGHWYTMYNARSTLVRIMKDEISGKVLLRFQRLRMLTLGGTETEDLLSAIGKVKHLRYLDASDSEIYMLPDALCKLYNLQTLHLDYCWSLQCLPHRFSNLISLRHLHFSPEDVQFKMPPNMGQLTCLQTLPFFNVGEEKGHGIKELGSMRNLAGKIRIRNLELVEGKEGARLANLLEKKKLMSLDLSWRSTDRGENYNDEHVLEGLETHPNLQKLGLENYMGDRLPQWFGQLKVLTRLRFVDCKSLKDLPTLGHLPYLQVLEIEGSEHVACIAVAVGEVFPSLKTMKLKNLPNLSEWKGLEAHVNGPVFPKLESLLITDCCQLASIPSPFPSLEDLQIKGNIQVSVVRDIIGNRAGLLKTLEIDSVGGLNSLADVVENHLTRLEEHVACIAVAVGEVFPSLKTMKLKNLPNLSGLEAHVNGPAFPELQRLHFPNCISRTVPSPFPSLEKLEIKGNIQVSVVRDIIGKSGSSLKKLEIDSVGWLNSLADVVENHLTCLEEFVIWNCDNLIDIPGSILESSASLAYLSVRGCPKLMPWALNLQQTPSLWWLFLERSNMFTTNVMPTGFRYLTDLRHLGIGPFTDDSIQSFDWSGLKACSSTLTTLHWYGSLQKHSSLPQQLQHLTSLLELNLISLDSVEALPDWLGNLTSLRVLELCDCPILERLPSARAMGRLTNLFSLRVINCPLVSERSIQDISSTLPNLKITQRTDRSDHKRIG